MPSRLLSFLLCTATGFAVCACPAHAAGTVRLVLIGDAQASVVHFQDWIQVLGKAGISNVVIRLAEASEKPGIETQGSADRPIYVVTGLVVSRDELLLPGGRYRPSDAARLAQWMKDLAEQGPKALAEPKGAFGLSSAQLDAVRADLAVPLGFETQGMTVRQVLETVGRELKHPIVLDANAAKRLDEVKLSEDLARLARGTVVAYLLRSVDYCFLPQGAGNELSYRVVESRPNLEAWPVGWSTEHAPGRLLPALFEFRDVNVQNYAADKVLEAVGKLVDAPVLFDRAALAKHGIDPSKALVSLPRRRTTYSSVLSKLLFQAGMKYDVRCDDAGKPFLWITSAKPA